MSEAARKQDIQPEAELKDVSAPAANPVLRWHTFLVKAMLPAAAVYHLFQVVWIASGNIYFSTSVRSAVYSGLPAMCVLDYACAALLIWAAVLQLLARKDLRALKASGIRRLNRAYILLTATIAAYGLLRFLIAGLSMLSLSVAGQASAYALLLLINRHYYRRHIDIFIEDQGPKE